MKPGSWRPQSKNCDIATFGTPDDRKTKLTEYINRRVPRVHEKSTEAEILSQKKEFTRIQKGDQKMKHRKRDKASGVSSNKSNFARAMRVRMPKVSPNLVPPKTPLQPETNSDQQIITSEVIFAPPPPSQRSELNNTLYFSTSRSIAPRPPTCN